MNLLNIMKLVPLIVSAVQAVEVLATGKKGKEKQDAAVGIVESLLPLIEGYVGKDLFDDAQVQQAVRTVIDAVVQLENVVRMAKLKALTQPPAPKE